MAQSRWEGDRIGKNQKVRQLQTYTPGQMELQRMGEERVGPNSNTARMAAGDQSMFDEMEAPALRQFSQLQGGMASRFSGLGGQGALSSRGSSGFQNSMNQAGQDFAGQLQANRQSLMRQATMDLHNMSQQLLSNRPYERSIENRQPDQGWDWGGTAGAVAGALPGIVTLNPALAASGGMAGYNAFKRSGSDESRASGLKESFGNWNNLWSRGNSGGGSLSSAGSMPSW